MPTTYEDAYDTITNELISFWQVQADNYDENGAEAPELRFANVQENAVPKASFARFSMNPVTERQETFRNGIKRYTSYGVLILQVFAYSPDNPNVAQHLRKLATVGKLAFRGKSFAGCIWFRNVRINNLDPEPTFARANVIAEYEFDEIG
jgi:hypothetical protein